MEDPSRRTVLHDFNLATRKAEEAALRRYQAAVWLQNFVGPLGLPNQPSESEFVSCLRNGLVLCNAINKIQPGSVHKVVESHLPSLTSETQQLNAYQYFENIRNFLVAVEELKLPAFEASDLKRDSLETGLTVKIVDCILALKSYHEWKQWSSGPNGSYKPVRSPMVPRSVGRIHSRGTLVNSLGPCRQLDMSIVPEETSNIQVESRTVEDSTVEHIVECLLGAKENIDLNLLASKQHGNAESVKLFNEIMSRCLLEQELNHCPELKSDGKEPLLKESKSVPVLTENLSRVDTSKNCKFCMEKPDCKHWHSIEVHEKDLLYLKELLSRTKKEFEVLQSQMQDDLQQLGSKVEELSFAALGYQRTVKENRDLYNMVQDLKGNIRVYCRIRPVFGTNKRTVVDHIGDDGSLVVLDPLKPHKDARKVFHFNQVFGPTASQEDVFKDTRSLIRSVMDGYNVCIFAYGQTGSGKTHTMCGPPDGSGKDMGIKSINYLALNDLFQLSSVRKDTVNYQFRVQMVEIYNEQVRDLLTEDSSTTKLEICNCARNGQLSLPDATVHIVASSTDVLNLMKLGETNCVVSSTAINNRSSRSHSILTVHVQGKDVSGNILRSCLHLVDLAGSERVDKSEVTGDRLKEAQYINKSLSCLGDVIMALAQKNSHIPYRNSKLTQLLQDSLGGHAKTLMFAHVSPESDSYGETVSTLKFAQRVSTVELGAACMNRESSEVNELREQVESLKKALSSKEGQTMPSNFVKDVRSPHEKTKVALEKTPRSRQLSIESSSAVKIAKTLHSHKAMEVRSPWDKAKVTTEKTPPHPRRLSIESSIVIKTADTLQSNKAMIERTPPRSHRGSTENLAALKTADSLQSKKAKDLRAPQEKPKIMTEQTPPRPRRLSIENSTVLKTENVLNSEYRKVIRTPAVTEKLRTEHTSTRPRRLSSEGTKYAKEQLQIRSSANVTMNGIHGLDVNPCVSPPQQICQDRSSDCRQFQNAEASISGRNCNDSSHIEIYQDRSSDCRQFQNAEASISGRNCNDSSHVEIYQGAPHSPTSSVCQNRRGFQSRSILQPVQLPKAPESSAHAKEDQACELECSNKSQTTGFASKKGSQIRKSLRTIGKLINNASDKRSHQNQIVAKSPIDESNNTSVRSPATASAKALRRQSLTCLQTTGLSRRSSLGGKPTDNYLNDNRNAKTPPPVHPSTNMIARWV